MITKILIIYFILFNYINNRLLKIKERIVYNVNLAYNMILFNNYKWEDENNVHVY